jgi:drug/metabolite transporter (DMT)-like permease
VLALRHAALSLVQPVLAVGLAFMLVLARRVLGEHVGRREVLGAAGIVAGVSLVVAAGPQRGAAHQELGLAVACGLLAAAALAPYVRRTAMPGVLVMSALAGDSLAALAANEVARELGARDLAAAGWAAVAAVSAIVALTSETTALQRSPATTVAPIVLAGQIAVPSVLGPLVAGDDWGATPLGGGLIAVGLALVLAATVVLGRSPAVGHVHHPGAAPT